MADDRKGAYSEVESLKKGKYRIGKDYKRLEIIIALLCSFIFMIIFTSDFFHRDVFFMTPAAFFDGLKGDFIDSKLNYMFFYPTMFLAFFYTYLFISKTNLVKKMHFTKFEKKIKLTKLEIEKIKEKTSNTNIFNAYTKLLLFYLLNFIVKIPYAISVFPFVIISKIVHIPEDLKPHLGIEASYLNKLEEKFFYQVVEKEDGYTRVKHLKIFEDRKKIFCGTPVLAENIYQHSLLQQENSNHTAQNSFSNINEQGSEEEYRKFKALFKNDKEFDDLFLIVEGYLTKSKLFDTAFYGQNDIARTRNGAIQTLKNLGIKNLRQEEIEAREYHYYQSYMLRFKNGKLEHDVNFSINAIKFFIEDKKKKIRDLIETKLLKYDIFTTTRRRFSQRANLLLQDIHFRKKILEYFKGNAQRENMYKKLFEVNINNDFIKKLDEDSKFRESYENAMKTFYKDLTDMLMLDFTLVLFRLIISQYMNLPAGTIVSKLKSYDTRMIIEYYKTFSEIEIVEKKNDGQSENFQSDNYVNVFMIIWAKAVDEIDIYQELYFRFNTNENIKPFTFQEMKEIIDTQGLAYAEEMTFEQRNVELNDGGVGEIQKSLKEERENMQRQNTNYDGSSKKVSLVQDEVDLG